MDNNEDLSPMEVLAGLKAGVDQMIANATDVGRIHWAYYQAFLAEGFTAEQSLWLAMAQFKTIDAPGDEE